jgi:uncharacterized RDD family membrane protein YckC/Tfp pilus assembly major pilin PilA
MFCTQCGNAALDTSKFCNKCGAALIVPVVKQPAGARPPPLPSQTVSQTPPSLVPAASAAAVMPEVYAGFARRAIACVIDIVVILLLYDAYLAVMKPANTDRFGPLAVFAFIAWIYHALMESSSWQATLGKRWLGIKVTSLSGERISFARATVRLFAQVLSQLCFYVGYLIAGFTKRRQALHDLIAGTLVVRRAATPVEITLATPQARGSGVLAVVLVGIVAICVIGVLAAIAIPAYQDYTLRAQVTHGLNLADPYKAAVAKALVAGTDVMMINSGPGGAIGAGLPETGTYEDSVGVVTGNIMIRYGQQANPHLQGRHLEIYMIQNTDGSLTWVCGKSPPPAGQNESSFRAFQRLTDVPDRYLPTICKG